MGGILTRLCIAVCPFLWVWANQWFISKYLLFDHHVNAVLSQDVYALSWLVGIILAFVNLGILYGAFYLIYWIITGKVYEE